MTSVQGSLSRPLEGCCVSPRNSWASRPAGRSVSLWTSRVTGCNLYPQAQAQLSIPPTPPQQAAETRKRPHNAEHREPTRSRGRTTAPFQTGCTLTVTWLQEAASGCAALGWGPETLHFSPAPRRRLLPPLRTRPGAQGLPGLQAHLTGAGYCVGR